MTSSTLPYDYIVVGAGSAGCVVAARLAERSDAQVLLIESGGSDMHPLVKMPIGFSELMGNGTRNWNYESEPELGLDARRLPAPRGRLLGGCSSINGMVYIRGQREDFDSWAAQGNTGWAYDDVLPLFKRSENHWAGASQYHGADGPLTVAPVTRKFPISDAFISAAESCGVPRNANFNGPSQEGVGYYDTNIENGIRHSSARAFIQSASRPANLTVVTHFDVARVLFDGERAVAVEGSPTGKPAARRRYSASQGIVLSAGSFNTPKLLELSGIGDDARLKKLGIKTIVNSPEVGEHLQDHCNNYVFMEVENAESYYDHIGVLSAPLTAANYLFRRKGIFANPAAMVGAFFSLDAQGTRPDFQIHFTAAAARPNDSGKLKPVAGVCASICQLRPLSRGSCHITNSDPSQAPSIRFNFLSHKTEQQRQVQGIRKLREIFAQAAIAPMLGKELPPLQGLNSDEELLSGIRASAESVHHPVGTCRMGPDPQAVVDPSLAVNGVKGLWIADASIMPSITSGNTHATCVMIAEKLVDTLLG